MESASGILTRIKELRVNKDLSQEELGKILGVTQRTVSGWENNEYFPSAEALIKMADIFNVSIDYLICRDSQTISGFIDDDPRLAKPLNELWRAFVKLSNLPGADLLPLRAKMHEPENRNILILLHDFLREPFLRMTTKSEDVGIAAGGVKESGELLEDKNNAELRVSERKSGYDNANNPKNLRQKKQRDKR